MSTFSLMSRVILTLALCYSLNLSATETYCPRIISQSPYLTKSLQWLGLESCIVGVSRYDHLDRPHTGGVIDPDQAAIHALEPDLIFTSNWTDEEALLAATPENARSFRLDGFGSMLQIEQNLRLLGRETGLPNIEQRVAEFHQQWHTQASQIGGNGTKVLLLSACSGSPYSFGQKRWLSEIFTQAGFINVETTDNIRHIKQGEAITTLNVLINKLQPDLLFIFEREQSAQCAFIKPLTSLAIINLDGEKFLHPAPVLLEGLEELAQHRNRWQR